LVAAVVVVMVVVDGGGGGGGGGDVTALSLNIPHITSYWASFVFSLHEQ
jgi:hypothetical protein